MRRLLPSALGLALAGCGSSAPAPSTDPAADQRRDTLVIAWASDIDSLNPLTQTSASDSAITDNVFTSLAGSTFDCSIKKEPKLATSWAWSADGKVLSMTLRDDAHWSDGKPVTADDLAFAYELASDPIAASPRSNYVERMEKDGRPKVVDATHIEWHFTEAYDRDTQFSHATALPPLPRHVLGALDRATLAGQPFSKQPIASGPWQVATYAPGERLVLEPNAPEALYGDTSPHLKRVIFQFTPEYSTRLLNLQNGTVDMMDGLNVEDADMLRTTNPNLRFERRGWRFLEFIVWNLQDPLFQDVRVRKALAMAVDSDALIQKLLTSASGDVYGKRAIGTITPALCGVHNDAVQPLPYDLAAAKALMAEAGWTDSNHDGVLDKDGVDFSFELKTNSGNSRRAKTSVLVQSNLKDLGVKVELSQSEPAAFFHDLPEKKFQAALAGWSAALFVDPSSVWHSPSADQPRPLNYPGYANPEVDALIEKGLATPIASDAAAYWKALQATVYADQPYMFLFWRDEIVAIDNRFQNTKVDVESPVHDLSQWSVPADKVKYQR